MKSLRLLVIALILMPNVAQSIQLDNSEHVCLASSDSVRQHWPHAWPSWTENMPGHNHRKCWFPAPDRNHKKKELVVVSRTKPKEKTEPAPKEVKPVVYNYVPAEVTADTFNERFDAAKRHVSIVDFSMWAQRLF